VRGDRIVGIVATGKGVTIHKADCHNLEAFSGTPERFLDVDWDQDAAGTAQLGRLAVVTNAEDSALAALTLAIAKQEGRIQAVRFLGRQADSADLLVDVEVRDTRHLAGIMASLRACPGIEQVERATS
jgi:GTP pyrophosphokinase